MFNGKPLSIEFESGFFMEFNFFLPEKGTSHSNLKP